LLERGVLVMRKLRDVKPDDEVIPSILVLTFKPETGKFKARLVACGNFMDKTATPCHSPAVGKEVWMPILAATWGKGWFVRGVDVVQAYLQSDELPAGQKRTVIALPKTMRELGYGSHAEVKRNIYGKRDAGRVWFETAKKFLLSKGLVTATYDNTVFVREGLIVLLYVDDVIVIGRTEGIADSFVAEFSKRFDCTAPVCLEKATEDEPFRFLTHEIYPEGTGSLHIGQGVYVDMLLDKWGMSEVAERRELKPDHYVDAWLADAVALSGTERTVFRGKVGSVAYLAGGTRPDLQATLGVLAQGQSAPTHRHMEAIDELIQYVKHTRGRHIVWQRDTGNGGQVGGVDIFRIDVEFDAAYGMGTKTRSGYVLYVDGNMAAWRSGKIDASCLSTCESELISSSIASRDGKGLYNLLAEIMEIALCETPQVQLGLAGDNVAANTIGSNEAGLRKVRHLDKADLFVRQVTDQHGPIKFVRSAENTGDAMTKTLGRQKLDPLLAKMGLQDGTNWASVAVARMVARVSVAASAACERRQ